MYVKRVKCGGLQGVTCVTLAALVLASGGWAFAQTSGSAAIWDTQGADCQATPGEAQPWTNKSYTPECRARFALGEFKTLDEKLRFLAPPGPNEKSAVLDIATTVLHLPNIQGSDGPAGLVRGAGCADSALPLRPS